MSNVSKLKKDVGAGNLGNKSATEILPPDWRHLPFFAYSALIIGSFGEVSNSQNIQVAHKCIPSDQEGSYQWMRKEIDLIKKINKKASSCHHVIVYSDLPGAEHSKDHYLKKIKNFLTDSKQNGGKRKIDMYIYYIYDTFT